MDKEDLIFYNTEGEKSKSRILLDNLKKRLKEKYVKVSSTKINNGVREAYRKIDRSND
jgi:hypothetical protein